MHKIGLNLKKELETGLKVSDLEMDKYLLEVTRITNQEEIDKLTKKMDRRKKLKDKLKNQISLKN